MRADLLPWVLAVLCAAGFVWASLRQHTERQARVKAENERDRAWEEAEDALEREARAARHTWGWFTAYRHEVTTRRRRRGCPRVHQHDGEDR